MINEKFEITDHDLKELTNKFFQDLQMEIGPRTAFARGFKLALQMVQKSRQAAVSGTVCLNAKAIEPKKRLFDYWCDCIVYHHPIEYAWFKVCPVCERRLKRQTDR